MLNKPFKFTSNKIEKIKISIIVILILVFILLFLKPFDMFSYIPNNKKYLYFGYGLSLFLAHLFTIFLEDYIYAKQNKHWYVKNEILVKLIYFFIGSLFIYFYHFLFVKTFQKPWTSFPIFVLNYTFPFFLIFLSIMIFYRNLKGEIYKETSDKVTIRGNNKNENFSFQKKDILFVKSENNYVLVYFLDGGIENKIMIRNTLSNILNQVPFLLRSHRSFLINPQKIKKVKGNSQKATLQLEHFSENIPISKTYYSAIYKEFIRPKK